ncbi:MAG: manganese-dependent inorganic pyrophosphatase [Veillonellaceae bacterium]|mgnify:FL=1|uniref:manganese-dependent inorganic pyrophosphatase n=1 Tax=Anaerovibrio lipolyticus TaxID=82374 RepID=UPI001F3B19D7|nr:manganese-dependent inorganic pyrophosphatase [Anaerovibrio lipolyticus]MCI7078858.1 manganese-dependent inorganic pyrophosphatase [Veillonellaceae bacterium]MDY5053302.1 manganese-dependent inorganic pyrophosphatase [Anaerovibrio sp.]MCF2600238.1 manganese-dependent inorganic pyrophosphatase [Anaerovibrio lipolyticus]MCI7091625.1 manganese-dependent inorganic pyrophosphatase [Veillonellaceae bacterium]MCI7234881.1 manganese-dependent inorganic pyrophosphatase [Veillonellaceae bacterium]
MSKVFITGHKNPDTDSICSALSYAALKQAQGVEAVAVRLGEVGKEAQYALDYFQVEAPELIASVEEKQAVMLVDHNEPAQSVDGLDKAELLEIVDHHRLGGLNTANPIFVHIEPVGCTATIITKMFDCQKVELPKKIAGLLLSAIVSDTVLFKSPTCTEQDKAAAEKLAVIAGVNLKEYGMAMLKAGADLGDLTPAQIAKTDSKPFSFGKYKAIVAQISVMDTADILAKKAELVAAMQELCQNEGYDMSLLMVTDIMEESTELVFVGEPKQLIADAFGKDASGDSIYLPGVMSRKKQIVPQLTEAAAKL